MRAIFLNEMLLHLHFQAGQSIFDRVEKVGLNGFPSVHFSLIPGSGLWITLFGEWFAGTEWGRDEKN